MTSNIFIDVKVGWAEPTEEDIRFNFHLTVDDYEWNEIHDYTTLSSLEHSIKSGSECLSHVYFPPIDKTLLPGMFKILSEVKYNLENLKLLEKYSSAIEAWILELIPNLTNIDDESRQLTKQLFFKSTEKIAVFEKLCSTINQNIAIVLATEKKEKNAGKSMFTKVTHKLFKSKIGSSIQNGQLNERNLHKANPNSGSSSTINETETASQLSSPKQKFTLNNFVRKIGGSRSVGGEMTAEMDEDAALDAANKLASHLRIEVQRGQKIKTGVLVYDIILRISSKKYATPVIYSTFQRYKSFKDLHQKLMEVGKATAAASHHHNNADNVDLTLIASRNANFMDLISIPFPGLKMKSYIGMKMNDSDLSVRTRSLDSWFRAVCTHYRNMPVQAKAAVRAFLNFDMARPKDIFVQDQLTWGTIDTPSTDTSVLIVQRSALESMPEGFMEQAETYSALDSANGNSPKAKNRYAPSVRDGDGAGNTAGGAKLQNLIWETASQGGANVRSAKHRSTGARFGSQDVQFSADRSERFATQSVR